MAHIDQWVFIKKGYSLWMHIVPFAVAGLLLVVLSVPEIVPEVKVESLGEIRIEE